MYDAVILCRYNMQALQDRLDSSALPSLPSVLQPALLYGAGPASGGGVDAALSHARNTSTIYESFREHSRRTVAHIQIIKVGGIRLNILKQRYSGPLIPRTVHDEITTLDRGLKLDTGILHEMIVQLNAGMSQFLQSPFSANKTLLSVISKDRETLDRELEQLRKILSNQPSGITPTSQAGHISTAQVLPAVSSHLPVPQVWTGPHPTGAPVSIGLHGPGSFPSHSNPNLQLQQYFPGGKILASEVSSTTGEARKDLPFYR